MKIIVAVLTAVLLVFGAGSMAIANEHGNDLEKVMSNMNVGQMKEMHPELSIHEFKEMYKDHHGTLGAAPSKNFKHHGAGMDN